MLPINSSKYYHLTNKIILAGIGLVAFCIVYTHALTYNFFIIDDAWMLVGFPLVYPESYNWQWVADVFTEYNNLTYSPLITLYFHLIYRINGMDPYYFHLGSLLLQMIDALLLYHLSKVILTEFNIQHARLMAYFTSLIWLIHPINAEAIVWIAAVKFGLSNMFLFISFIFYIRATKKLTILNFSSCLLGLVCACLCKEQAIFAPYLFISFTVCRMKRWKYDGSKRWLYIGGALIAASGLFVYINMFLSDIAPFRPATAYPVLYRICFAAKSLFIYLGKMIFPYPLKLYYPFPLKQGAPLPFYYYTLPIAFAGLYFFVYKLYSKMGQRTFFIFCSLFFFINIGMCLQIFPMGVRSNMLAPRYMYLPSIPVLYLLLLLVPFSKLPRALIIVSCFIILLVVYNFFYVNSWSELNIT